MSGPPDILGQTFDVDVARTIDAAPHRVFRAWVDPALFQRWFEATQLQMDPREGGLFFIEVEHEGRRWAHYGRYLAVEPPRRLVFTWMSEATHGYETTVTVTITPVADGRTELRLTHEGIPESELSRGHEEGWRSLLATIEPFLGPSDPDGGDQ